VLGIVLAFVAAAPVCVALAGRRPSWLRLSLAVVGSQAAFHGLLAIGVGAPTSGGMTPVPGHAGHLDAVLTAATSVHAMPAHTDAAMWLAHAVAAAITIAAFGRGEQALRLLLELVGRRLCAWRPVALPATARVPRTRAFPRLIADPGLVVLSAVSRRGPPLAA